MLLVVAGRSGAAEVLLGRAFEKAQEEAREGSGRGSEHRRRGPQGKLRRVLTVVLLATINPS